MTRSLPLRATLIAALALAALATALVLAIGWQANRTLSARTLDDIATESAELAALHAKSGVGALEARIGERLEHDRNATRVLHLVDAGGAVRAGTFRNGGDLDLEGVRRNPVFTYRSPRTAMPRLAVGRVVGLGAGSPQPLVLLVARDIEDQRDLAFQVQVIALSGLAALGIAALAFGYLAQRRLRQRITTISATSQAIMSGSLAARIPRDGSGDEIDGLAGNLNEMLARIDGLMQALRDVSDNIAHDLKTPINRLRNTAEQALREPPAGQRDALAKIIEQADGIIQTFNALLQIARLEHGATDLVFEDLALDRLAMDVVELYEPVADSLNLSLQIGALPATTSFGHRQLLGQALANLIDNAIKYSAASTAASPAVIDIRIETDATHHRLIVADSGPGIAAADRERAVKRFGRLDASRSLPGTGLGLSLVAAIARLHGGALLLDDNAPRGLKAILVLPRTPVRHRGLPATSKRAAPLGESGATRVVKNMSA